MSLITSRTIAGLRSWAVWTVGFLSFPLAGIAGGAIAGPVDSPFAAALGGAVTGLVIGTGQWLASGRRLRADRWIPATTIGMGLGLLIGATAVGFGTELAELALLGAITGIPLGIAQALALPSRTRFRWVWAAVMPVLWSLGWTITTLVGVDVETQYTVFGSTGAITVSALAGLVLGLILPSTIAAGSTEPATSTTTKEVSS
jgi:hypothetical protein